MPTDAMQWVRDSTVNIHTTELVCTEYPETGPGGELFDPVMQHSICLNLSIKFHSFNLSVSFHNFGLFSINI